jgi:hypothetical protein
MKYRKTLRTVSMLIFGLALATTAQTYASLRFNGSNTKAVLDGSYLDGNTHGNYAFEMWIKPFSLGGTLIGKTESWKDWTLDTMVNGGLRLRGTWPNYYWGDQEVGAGSIKANVWQHVCCSVADGLASFYVNGYRVGTESVQNPIDFYGQYPNSSAPSLDAAMAVGYTDSGTTPDYNFFNGLIYGIKVWSRTLSEDEVRAIATTGTPLSTNGLYNAVMLNEGSGTAIHDALTPLTGRVLTAQWSSENPPITSMLDVTNGLVAYFPFNGNANDASGNGHNGTVNGATLTTDRFGQANQAYLFGGASAYITVPFASSVFSGDFTASVWFNASDIAGGWPTLLYEENQSFLLEIAGLACGCAGPGHLISLSHYPPYPAGTFSWNLDWPEQTPIGMYQQVVVTKAGTNVTMYLNGQIVVVGNVTDPQTQLGQNLIIGNNGLGTAWGGQFHGVVDDIRIYNRALPAQEVEDLYYLEAPEQPWMTIQVKTVQVTMHVKSTKKYQLKASLDLKTWTNMGDPFVATSSEIIQEFNTIETGRYFQLLEVP